MATSSRIRFTLAALLLPVALLACPVCEKSQPKLLRGLTHGAGPESNWDYVIIGIAAALVMASLYYSVKWLCKPGEAGNDHIKRIILGEFKSS
ncbi:MAG: hypothetical protein ICV83_20255 [Cytophagales bacterium]|nr:hypothetical protein [Cytophagales bacterium]